MSDKKLVAATKPYVRILIRVPEAYLLLRPYNTTRPGLLILDADGRRIDSIALPGRGQKGEDQATVVQRLKDGVGEVPFERVRAHLLGSDGCKEKVRRARRGVVD